jgi:hypothetical protein
MGCAPNHIEGCHDLPPRPPLRRIEMALFVPSRGFDLGFRLSLLVAGYEAVRTGGSTMRAIGL